MKRIIPYLGVENCQGALAFYQQVFGGEVKNVQMADENEMFTGHEGTGSILNGTCQMSSRQPMIGEI